LGVNAPPARLSSHLLALSSQEAAVAQQTLRIDALHSRLQADLNTLRETLRHLENGEEYQLPPDLSARITEWTRMSRILRNKTEDYKGRLEEMAAEQLPKEAMTVPALVQQEREVLALKEAVLDLEAQARGFQGLPPEKDLARLEVERVQRELEELEAQKEALYDGMIGRSR
jgi:HAUS augmin-like complex subunit 1